MSAKFGQDRRSRSRSPTNDYAKKSLLAKVNKSELKLLRVAVRRNNVIATGPHLPFERSIDDPAKICEYVHYRKDPSKLPQPPIFGRGIKVNQDFTENRRVFTDEKSEKRGKSSRKSRSTSRHRSRSPKTRTRSSRNKTRSPSRSPDRGRNDRSRRSKSDSRGRSTSRNKSRNNRRNSSRSSSKHRSRSRERKYSSEKRKYKEDSRKYSSQKSRRSRSSSRSVSPHERTCPMYRGKSLTPLRPGEYRPGHPDLALRNKRPRSRSRSGSYNGRSRSKRSRSRDDSNLPSTSRDKTSPGRYAGSSRSDRRHSSPVKTDKRERRSKSRSPIKTDRYRRRSRSPYGTHSPSKRSYKNRSPRRRSRSPHFSGAHGENMHAEYGYYDAWGPGPRLPAGRGGYPMQPFYPPAFHPRGMIPGAIIPPGLMLVPRAPMMTPFRPYRPHYPVYNSGAVSQKGTKPNTKPATVTSENDKDSQVEISEVNSQDGENNEENTEKITDKNGEQESGEGEGKS